MLGAFDSDVITVEWNLCNGQNISDIFTSKMFGCGRGAQKTMGVWARELIKSFRSLCSTDESLMNRIEAVLKCPRSAIQSDDFELLLQTILSQANKLVPTRVFLLKYSRQHVLHCVCKTFFPSITEVQVAQCRCPPFIVFVVSCLFELPRRVGALMREPNLQSLFHEMANPLQTRQALEEGAGVSAVRTRCYIDFAAAYNNSNLCPHFAVDVSLWVNVVIDVSVPPDNKPWIWVAEAMTEIKRKMTLTLRNFSTSGNLANDSNDMARDLQFWCDFCHGDPVLFYIYMAWDHGRDIPAWNSTLLPAEQRLDLGAGALAVNQQMTPVTSSASKGSKRPRDGDLTDLVEMQTQLFRSIASNPGTAGSAASTATAEASGLAKLEALSKSADILRQQLGRAAEDRKLFDYVVSSSREGSPPSTFDYEGHVQGLHAQLVAVLLKMTQVAV